MLPNSKTTKKALQENVEFQAIRNTLKIVLSGFWITKIRMRNGDIILLPENWAKKLLGTNDSFDQREHLYLISCRKRGTEITKASNMPQNSIIDICKGWTRTKFDQKTKFESIW